MPVSCIIPAYNEERTVARVVTTAKSHHSISEVIVVDDASTDNTAQRATDSGAIVITNTANLGKGGSMHRGVSLAKNDIVLFLDADLLGLTTEHLAQLISPVLENPNVMTVAIRDRGIFTQLNKRMGPYIGGERCLPRTLWDAVPESFRQRFMAELALNAYARRRSFTIQPIILKNLTIVKKEQKYGILKGLRMRIGMILDLVLITIRLWIK